MAKEETAQPNMVGVAASQDQDTLETGRKKRAEITRKAQAEAAESLDKINVAMEADEAIDEAQSRVSAAEGAGDREQLKAARRQARETKREARARHKEATKSARQAYHAIKFSEPNKLGFMRLLQVGYALHIAWTLVLLLLTSRDEYAYGLGNIASWVLVILEGMAFWAFVNRYKVARTLVIIVGVLSLGVDMVIALTNHSLGQANFIIDALFYIVLILYFAFSGRVRSTLVNDLSTARAAIADTDELVPSKGWTRARNLTIYFIVFSILGHWMEMAMCQLIRLGLVEGEYDPTNTMLWRDWLYPFPMEGAAVVIIALALYPLYQWLKRRFKGAPIAYVISFIANALACSAIEFGMGLIVNANHELWDYSENFGNIMGQVCLQNAMAFGAACSVIAWFVYPMLERWMTRLPNDYLNIAFVATLIFGGIIWSLYIVEPPQIQEGTIASGSYTTPSGKTGASFSVTGEQPDGEDTSGLQLTIDRGRSTQETIAGMRAYASELREQLDTDESLSQEQKDQISEQLDEISQQLDAIEDGWSQEESK